MTRNMFPTSSSGPTQSEGKIILALQLLFSRFSTSWAHFSQGGQFGRWTLSTVDSGQLTLHLLAILLKHKSMFLRSACTNVIVKRNHRTKVVILSSFKKDLRKHIFTWHWPFHSCLIVIRKFTMMSW